MCLHPLKIPRQVSAPQTARNGVTPPSRLRPNVEQPVPPKTKPMKVYTHPRCLSGGLHDEYLQHVDPHATIQQ